MGVSVRHAPQGARGIDMVGVFQPLADVDERQGVEHPIRQMRVREAIEVVAPVAPFLDQPLGAQEREMLRDTGGGQIERLCIPVTSFSPPRRSSIRRSRSAWASRRNRSASSRDTISRLGMALSCTCKS